MDYKELIEELRTVASFDGECHDCDWCLKAATAIETLLAEREALMEQIHGQCDLCVNRLNCLFDDEAKWNCASNKGGNWQWRGPTPPDRQQTER